MHTLPIGARIGTTRLRDSAGTTVIAFSQDGHRLAYGNEVGLIQVCEAADGKPLLELQPDKANFNPVTELAFSPDGRTLAVGGYWYEALWLIDLATRKVRHTIPNTAPGQNRWGREWQGSGFAFTPDGQRLLTTCIDRQALLWDWRAGTIVSAPMKHTDEVYRVEPTPDGRYAYTGPITAIGSAGQLQDAARRRLRLAKTDAEQAWWREVIGALANP